jgi:hypothetical protein
MVDKRLIDYHRSFNMAVTISGETSPLGTVLMPPSILFFIVIQNFERDSCLGLGRHGNMVWLVFVAY